MAREYFHCYHSMLRGTRNLSEAECGRLFRALLAYSAGDELINLQGREAAVFDVYAEQIDREKAAYEDKCEKMRRNGKAKATNCQQLKQLPPIATNCGQGEDEDKDENNNPPTPPRGRGRKVFEQDSYPYRLAKAMSEDICARLGCKEHSEATLQSWAGDIDKCHRIDGRPWEEVGKVLEFSQNDSFWRTNILSGGKFRKQYLLLLGRAREEGRIDG